MHYYPGLNFNLQKGRPDYRIYFFRYLNCIPGAFGGLFSNPDFS